MHELTAVNFRERSFFVNIFGAVVNCKIAATLVSHTPKDIYLSPKTGINLCYVKFKGKLYSYSIESVYVRRLTQMFNRTDINHLQGFRV